MAHFSRFRQSKFPGSLNRFPGLVRPGFGPQVIDLAADLSSDSIAEPRLANFPARAARGGMRIRGAFKSDAGI
jgi:hypothetical protein